MYFIYKHIYFLIYLQQNYMQTILHIFLGKNSNTHVSIWQMHCTVCARSSWLDVHSCITVVQQRFK